MYESTKVPLHLGMYITIRFLCKGTQFYAVLSKRAEFKAST